VPYDTQRVDVNTDAGDDDELITNSKDLYKRFNQDVEANKVQFNKIAAGKKEGGPTTGTKEGGYE